VKSVVRWFAIGAVGVLAACGGDGGGGTYSPDATASCLRDRGARSVSTASDDLDLIADSAPGGGLRAEVGEQEIEVQIAFGRTEGDADSLESAYQPFMDEFGGHLEREGNAVMAWSFDPSDSEKELVTGCLR
jgi:hypothetical protein